MEYFYSRGKSLNIFLSDGNYLKLVTSMDSHDSANFIFTELLIYETIKEHRNQVSVFLTAGEGNRANLDTLSKVAKISRVDEYSYVENENGVKAADLSIY